MIEEINAAAKWWTDQLRSKPSAPSDSGGGELMILGRMRVSPLSDQQIEVFENALRLSLLNYLTNKPWDEYNPQSGSGLRAVQCDWRPDNTIHTAIQAAQITGESFRLPIKTTMWINPGSVTVQIEGQHQVIYSRES